MKKKSLNLQVLVVSFITATLLASCASTNTPTGNAALNQQSALSPEAAYNLGMEYATAGNAVKDYSKAFELFTESAGRGYLRSRYALGWMYYSGTGVTRDYDKAFPLFKDAAEKGLSDAQLMLSLMYGNGWGTQKDTKLSLLWTQKAAANGNKEAIKIIELLKSGKPPTSDKPVTK